MDSDLETDFLNRLADAADIVTLRHYRQTLAIEEKIKPGYDFDPVTLADKEAERAIRDLISSEYPDHSILGEEFGMHGEGDHQWVIDPIDGTRPFICGIPVWGTLIGHTVKGVARSGIMSQPFTSERFWADGREAWTRRSGSEATPLRSRKGVPLADAILHTNSPELYASLPHIRLPALQKAVRMTRYGGECYAFAMLAAGQIDLCLEPSLQPYDIVALIPIIEQAGGIVTDISGNRAENGGAILASADPKLHDATLTYLNS